MGMKSFLPINARYLQDRSLPTHAQRHQFFASLGAGRSRNKTSSSQNRKKAPSNKQNKILTIPILAILNDSEVYASEMKRRKITLTFSLLLRFYFIR